MIIKNNNLNYGNYKVVFFNNKKINLLYCFEIEYIKFRNLKKR